MRVRLPGYQRNKWVRGHQEETIPYAKLPLEAQMNVDTDELATEAIIDSLKKDRVLNAIPSPYCKAYLQEGKMYLTKKQKRCRQSGKVTRYGHT
jgi:hypothetical protein